MQTSTRFPSDHNTFRTSAMAAVRAATTMVVGGFMLNVSASAQTVDYTQETVSLTNDGFRVFSGVFEPSLDGLGDRIAFSSYDPDLAVVDTKHGHVYVRDRVAEATILVSRGKDNIGNGLSREPDISQFGEHVAYTSNATNLICEDCDTNLRSDIYLFDLYDRAQTLISGTSKSEANSDSYEPSVSFNGERVTFTSWATNLVAGDTNKARDVFLWDRYKGIRRLASSRVSSPQQFYPGNSHSPQISDDGRYVVFVTDYGPNDSHVYKHNVETGITDQVSEGSSLTYAGYPLLTGDPMDTGLNIEPSISTNGDYVAWASSSYLSRDARGANTPFRIIVQSYAEPYGSFELNNHAGTEQRQPQIFGSVISAVLGGLFPGAGQFGVAYTSTVKDGPSRIIVQHNGTFDALNDHFTVISAPLSGEAANGNSHSPAVGAEIGGVASHMWRVAFVTGASNLGLMSDEDGGASDVIFVERTQ